MIGGAKANGRAMPLLGALLAALASTMIAAAPAGGKSLKALLESREDLSVFTHAMQQTSLWARLDSNEPMTMFVPSNEAMHATGSAFLMEEVLITNQNISRLLDRIAMHMVPRNDLSSDKITQQVDLYTLAALCVSLRDDGDTVRVGLEALATEHISAENGSLYVLDRMLWRPWDGGDQCVRPAQ